MYYREVFRADEEVFKLALRLIHFGSAYWPLRRKSKPGVQSVSVKSFRQWAGNFLYLTALRVIQQPSRRALIHKLLAY